jgi:diguanylate cyclase (GGDEF)-like protein/PAS domain S-box-containing protein
MNESEIPLFRREQMFHTLVENSPDIICRYDLDGVRIYANAALVGRLGATAEDLLGIQPSGHPLLRDAQPYEQKIRQVAHTGQQDEHELSWTGADGKAVISHIRLIPERDHAGKVVGVLAVSRDITALKRTEERLKAAQRLARLDVWEWDIGAGRFEMIGARVAIDHIKTLPQLLLHTVHPDEVPALVRRLDAAFKAREENVVVEFRGLGGDGSVVDTITHACIQYGPGGEPEFMWGTMQDIGELKQLQRKLHTMAFYDPLTGLPNRTLFLERLNATVARAESQGLRLGVLALDLDNFKAVNDSFGHRAGDGLLREVAERLRGSLAPNQMLARLGGNEYAVMLPDAASDNDIAATANKLLNTLADVFSIGPAEVFLSASMGVARFPEDGGTAAELLQRAGSAVYLAKEQGRNNFQFHSPMQVIQRSESLMLAAGLRHAVDNRELELYYQPQIDLDSGRLIGVEALLRWNHPELGAVSPSRFIPIAEDTGLIVDIGEWVLRQACQAACAWNRDGGRELKVAVNLSPRQLKADGFVDRVRKVLDDTGCQASWVEFEITEGVLLDDSLDIPGMFETLRGVGFSFAIDDFGTGYSALSYLHRFDVDKLKIDRSFIGNLLSSEDSSELVKAIIAMARSLRLKLVAEGVEEPTQEAFLRANGCHAAQGYLYGKPMPRQQFEQLRQTIPD